MNWYFDESCSSWLGIKDNKQFNRLLDDPIIPLVQISKLNETGEYLVWILSKECKKDFGDYFLYSPRTIGEMPNFDKYFKT